MVKNLPTVQEPQELQVRFLGQEDPLELQGNPLQDSCLENPWTEEFGRLQSIGVVELDMTEAP